VTETSVNGGRLFTDGAHPKLGTNRLQYPEAYREVDRLVPQRAIQRWLAGGVHWTVGRAQHDRMVTAFRRGGPVTRAESRPKTLPCIVFVTSSRSSC
jgi:hypothetical protein